MWALSLSHSLRGSHLREFIFRNWRKECFYDFGVFTVGCDVENEAEDSVASGHGILLPINLHNCAAFSISHRNLSPLFLFLCLCLCNAHGLLLIEFFTNWHLFVPRNVATLQSRFRRITRSSPLPAQTPVGQLKFFFLSLLLLFSRVVQLSRSSPTFPCSSGPQSTACIRVFHRKLAPKRKCFW